MNLSKHEVAQMIDISAVQSFSTKEDVENIIEAAKKHRFICVFALHGFTQQTLDALKNEEDIIVGGVVGFPSGGELTKFKVEQAKTLIEMGCKEIDMVLNVGWLKSGMDKEVAQDIRAVADTCGTIPLKVIMEVPILTDDEIARAAHIICDNGASFLKTGTGWSGSTTEHHIKVIKDAVGDTLPLKVAGGVRDLETLSKMVDMGVSRFGIGYKAALEIMEELN